MDADFKQIVTAVGHNSKQAIDLIATIAYAADRLEAIVKDFPSPMPDDEFVLWIKNVEISVT